MIQYHNKMNAVYWGVAKLKIPDPSHHYEFKEI